MGQERGHFTDEFKQEAIALLAGSGRRLVADCRRAGGLALDAAQLAQSPGRAACGVGGARETGVGHALRCGPGGRDLPASPRELLPAHGARHFRKGCGALLGSAEMRFRLIEDQRDVWPVRVMCDALSVSPSGYYAWRSRPESPREIANRELPSDIRRVHAEHRGRMGGRVSTPNCVPRARASAASGSSG